MRLKKKSKQNNMKTEVKNKLHNELKDNIKKVAIYYKDIVSYNDFLKVSEKVADELGFEVKREIIPKVEYGKLSLVEKFNELLGKPYYMEIK